MKTRKRLLEENRALRAENATLKAQLAELLVRVAHLENRIAELEAENARARKNSSNSSKPPSSDIVKPPRPSPPKGQKKRKRGGQPGHPKHERAALPPEKVDQVHSYTLERCPDCNRRLKRAKKPPRIVQQMELVEKPVRLDEHQAPAYYCPKCEKFHHAPFPPEVAKGGIAGPRLTALIAYLKGACHASYSTIQNYLRDALRAPMSRGELAKIVAKASDALDAPYAELLDLLPDEARLNVDETGHKDSGDLFWTWCLRAELYTFFKIADSRGSKVLVELLGREFEGVLGCDYFSAYRKYMKDFDVLVQFCLAHLIREVKFLSCHPDAATSGYGKRLLSSLRGMFGVIHRREELTPRGFMRKLRAARRDVIERATRRVPGSREAQNLAKRFRKHGDAYFRFITTPGVEPTNNLAEQAIRFVVIDRRVTQGTRGEKGRRWCERIWTVLATCASQGRSAYEFILGAVRAYFTGTQAPSLLPMPP